VNASSEAVPHALSCFGLLSPGDSVLVATSGGPDSLSLLHALAGMRDTLGLSALSVAHLNHSLRGTDAAEDAVFVDAFCREYALPCVLGTADAAAIAHQQRISVQQAARQARYAFLDDAARRQNATKIATAHTQDDQTETVLLHILRGTGLDGLRGIPARRGPYIRPLLGVSRADILAYCQAQGLTPRQDSSNLEADHYTRNRIRLDLLPQLERDFNPAVRSALLRLSETAARDADFLHTQADAALVDATLISNADSFVLDSNRLRTLHPSLLRHVLRAALAQFRGTGDGLTHEHFEPLCDALRGNRRLPFGLTTPAPHCSIRVTPRRLTIRPRPDLRA
jgi:tRNA(Ile)-lysidine synthase